MRRWACLPLLALLLIAPRIGYAGEGAAVSLLPEGESQLEAWSFPVTLAPPQDPACTATLSFPAEPKLLTNVAAIDELGMVWHLELTEPRMYGEIRFVTTPSGMDLDPFMLFLSTTLFHEEAIALAQSDGLLEVEAPVQLNGQSYRGCFRAEQRGDVVAVCAYALAEPVSADIRATAWESLRLMLPPPPEID